MDRTDRKDSTETAQGSSRVVRYQLISPSGEPHGIYDHANMAAMAAQSLWPGVAQRSDDNGRDGWDIEVVR